MADRQAKSIARIDHGFSFPLNFFQNTSSSREKPSLMTSAIIGPRMTTKLTWTSSGRRHQIGLVLPPTSGLQSNGHHRRSPSFSSTFKAAWRSPLMPEFPGFAGSRRRLASRFISGRSMNGKSWSAIR